MALRPETLKKYVELARPILIEVAKGKRKDKLIPYKQLMDEMGGPGRGFIGEVLEEICQSEHHEGRPLLSALVVHENNGHPGDGFWETPVVPKDVRNGTKEVKKNFWEEQCREVWKQWK